MLLRSTRLKNIRSYIDEQIDFPLGSVLLSGDVGSGKSTILLAMDFGLFGLRKGELEGTDLLRHGKDHGSVTIIFGIADSEIEITRTLKRSKDSAVQDSGTIIINGRQQDLMPTELKSKILDMFGYSQEILKKNRPIFRYTVYTPQEKMKDILFDEDTRLATLRKIFSIDKYGQIKSNAKLFVTELRSIRRENEAFARDLEQKMAEKEEKETERERVLVLLDKYTIELSAIDAALAEKTEFFESLKKKMNEISAVRRKIAGIESETKVKSARLPKVQGDIKDVYGKMSGIGMAEEGTGSGQVKEEIADLESKKERMVSEHAIVSSDSIRLEELLRRGVCSFCNQPVSKGNFQKHLDEKNRILEELKKNMDFASAKIAALKEKQSMIERINREKILLEEYRRQYSQLEEEQKNLSLDISLLRDELSVLEKQIDNEEEIEKMYSSVEAELTAINKNKIAAEKEKSRCEQQLYDIERFLRGVEKEIAGKRAAKEKILYINELINWFEACFVPLMDIIEKHVMSALQNVFNDFFQNWFGIIMGEQFSVRIDEDFSPVIEQNGYTTEYSNLSGGEKTAVALAYRLALNKVINSMIETIKTKDILILDEPTDGFSSEQLDRIRNVIAELSLRQIILVSHEPKIDTFVDNVIKIYKEDHVSKVVY